MSAGGPVNAKRGRLKLVVLGAVAAAPLILAYALFFSGWRPPSYANYGELVQPPRSLSDAELVDLDGKAFKLSSLRGKWLYVYFGSSDCGERCLSILHKIRQVIIAQEKHMDRVQRLFVLTDGGTPAALADRFRGDRGLYLVRPAPAALPTLVREFAVPAGSDRIYLVDPLGNLMMSYPAEADPTGMRKDLARLLRVSRVG